MTELPALSLAEWVVLGVICEQPTHGFAIAQVTAPGGELGRAWQVPRPVVYRAIGRLAAAGFVTAESVEPGQGPQRTIYAASSAGRAALDRWLQTPVEHVREVRSHLLMKLGLLYRAGADPAGLIARQQAALAPIAAAMQERPAGAAGFDAALLAWRRANAEAAVSFLADLAPAPSGPRTP